MNIIEPRILKGTRDFLPQDKAKRDFVMKRIISIFERYGYDSIETPVIEYAETILGKYGAEGDKLTYNFEDHGCRQVALRYDQTVPFARLYAANHNDLPSPFKRYQISRVWRADKPQKGRYREFYQCDIDIIGTDSLLVELELVKVMNDVLLDLGFEDFTIKMNDRALMDSVLDGVGVPAENRIPVITAIDKLEKIGQDGVWLEFDKIGISDSQKEELSPLLDRTGTNEEKLERFDGFMTKRIEKMLELSSLSDIKPGCLQFDVSLARGLDYYTGIIFEVVLNGVDIGSVCGGGRYDDLCGSFSKKEFTGTGISFGFDRLVLAMEESGLLEDVGLNSKVLVTLFDEKHEADSINVLEILHNGGINAEMYFEPVKLGKQFKYADKKGIPYVVVAGPEEVGNSSVLLKTMASGEQQEVALEDLINHIS